MKKWLVCILSVVMIFALAACGGKSSESADTDKAEKAEKQTETKQTVKEDKVYGVGDTWTVDGQWSLTVDSIEVTDERNEFDESNPEQVVYIKYHYENLGWEDEDGLMDGLFIAPENVIDSDGNMCDEYPVNPDEIYADEVPVGAKCNGAEAYGLIKAGSPVTVNFIERDSSGNKQTAKYVLEF